ncbi:LSU ribosomal protein L6P [Thiohalospira halophila DSM 15071]|uniref:Large ribosomal subunit protein uL6 n=1 Tax=Thiohalospira halophila DSM 15071 TaxID=1123397 RepID=A0A1I1PV11_9GAMM|nr:50S ribosomal protein L6 [Thiohalospira halophila]SFD13686.1 LSU ribosomal protein L6P [Thiohalospira halophila DSM 15071]
MARTTQNPLSIPSGVELQVDGRRIQVKGSKGELEHDVHQDVDIEEGSGEVRFRPRDDNFKTNALTGTTRAVVRNMIQGVSEGFERRLQMVGVGYRAQAQGQTLNLNVGFSHPVNYEVPEGITIETPSQTEILVKGIDKQQVGQVAAELRAYRPPEPYKGKGVRYADERVIMKEAKKK